MLSINTNLSSLIAQNSMNSATKLLNQAVERMTTGYKINHASDNAAGYSISTNMQTQLSSYDVAADNVAMGMDLVTTASDIISNMQNKASRLQALSIQARNGTYGAQSMAAINSEATAIMAEINRLYSTAEYNNISLFNNRAYEIDPSLPRAGASGFIDEPVTYAMRSGSSDYGEFITDPKTYTDEEVAAMTRVADVSTFSSGQKYSISSVEELQKLANYVNSCNDTTGVEFVLGSDIDLSSVANWTPIGISNGYISCKFNGTFDGNGHVIKNLSINNPTEDFQGLFGSAFDDSEIKNIGIEGGIVKGQNGVGGLVGDSNGKITNSYTTVNVTGTDNVGGLAGSVSQIDNSHATGNVYSTGDYVGGLVGLATSDINNSYATGDVRGVSSVGGLAGESYGSISSSYATGNVTGQEFVGGLTGYAEFDVNNSFAMGDVNGTDIIGGLTGITYSTISNSYATGNVSGTSSVGGLAGVANNALINDSISYSQVNGTTSVGAIVGLVEDYGTFNLVNVNVLNTTYPIIGYYYDDNIGGENSIKAQEYENLITRIQAKSISTILQVGINGDSSCQIAFDTNFSLNIGSLGDLTSDSTLASITEFQKLLSEKATALGAVENRLQSALESIEVNIENLTSSLSTIRDADIAEVSSEYIRQQILQQASATLMATANQAPSIALQLI